MSQKNFLVDLNMNLQEIKSVVAEKVAVLPATATAGRYVYYTVDNQFYYGNGTSWVTLGDVGISTTTPKVTITESTPNQFVINVAVGDGVNPGFESVAHYNKTENATSTPTANTIAMWDASNQLGVNTTPTAANHATSKQYVDAQVAASLAGLSWKDAAKAASTQDLTAETFGATGVTYANGTAGVGATLTQDDPTDGVFGSLDGIAITVGDRVVIMDQTAGAENGIYELTEAGDGSVTPWVLTRVTDADTSAELDSAAIFIQQGTTKGDNGYTQTTSNATIGTTALVFVQFNGAANIIAGNGLTKTGNTLDVGAGDGISVAADSVATAAYVPYTYRSAPFTIGSLTGVFTETLTVANAISYANISVFDTATGEEVMVQVERTSNTTYDITVNDTGVDYSLVAVITGAVTPIATT